MTRSLTAPAPARPARGDVASETILSKRERNKRDKLYRIADAARDLFHEQGFMATTTQQVAQRAGVASGTIFLYVNTKEDLLTLAFAREMKAIAATAFDRLEPEAPFADQVSAFFDTMLHYHGRDLVIARELMREVGFLRDPRRDYGIHDIPFLPSLQAIARRARAAGELLETVDVELVALALFSFYWLTLRELVHERQEIGQCRQQLRALTDLLLAGAGRMPRR